jgi:hypothetical protein
MKLNGCVFMLTVTGATLMAQQAVFTQRTSEGGPLTINLSVIGGEMVGGPALTGAPYSAEAVTETTQTLADGNRIVNKSTSKIYRDSAGRERREQPLPNFGKLAAGDTAEIMIMISDPVAKVNYSLQTRSKTAEKMPAPGPFTFTARAGAAGGTFTQALPAPGARGASVFYAQGRLATSQEGAQIKTEDLGKRTIEGVIAEGTRETTTIPAGQVGNERPIDVVSERWYSPELQVLVMSKNTDPRMGETIYQLTNVSRVEPLSSLFEVPPDYKVNDVTNGAQKVYRRTETNEHTAKDDQF